MCKFDDLVNDQDSYKDNVEYYNKYSHNNENSHDGKK